jgi:predicted nucleic acid-binding protein
MIAVDTSVVVAAFASWHEGHASAAATLARRPRVPAHVLLETYSVLTRLPPPHRAPANLVAAFLAERFSAAPLVLPGAEHARLVGRAAEAGIVGGSIHDALVGATVRHARGRLLTRDRRAAPTYERLGVDYELIT